MFQRFYIIVFMLIKNNKYKNKYYNEEKNQFFYFTVIK